MLAENNVIMSSDTKFDETLNKYFGNNYDERAWQQIFSAILQKICNVMSQKLWLWATELMRNTKAIPA